MSFLAGFSFRRSVSVLSVFLVACLPLLAQYTLDRAVLSNGSGTSAAGRFSVEGTVGQALVGTQTGGAYVLSAGFWSLVTLVPSPGAPVLRMQWDPSDAGPRIAWAKPAEGWVLQQAEVLAGLATEWAPIQGPYEGSETDWEVIVTAPLGQRFFRLHKE